MANEYGESTARVVPIRRGSQLSTSSGSWLDERKLVGTMTEDQLKQVIDSQVAASLAAFLQQPPRLSNPFDAVYLSDLQPDTLAPGSVARFKAYQSIVDLSEQMIFSDDD